MLAIAPDNLINRRLRKSHLTSKPEALYLSACDLGKGIGGNPNVTICKVNYSTN